MTEIDERAARERIVFSMSLGYERSGLMKEGLEHMELMELVQMSFYEKFPAAVHEAWLAKDIALTAALKGALASGASHGHASPFSAAEAPWLQPAIRAVSVAAFKNDATFRPVIEQVDERLAPLGLVTRQVELVGCTSCGPKCWNFDLRLSVDQKAARQAPGKLAEKAFEIPVERPVQGQAQGVREVVATLPVLVFVSFTCSNADYEAILKS